MSGDEPPRPGAGETAAHRRLVELATDPLWIVAGGRFQEVNGAFLDLVGYDRETLVGAPPARVIHEDDRGEWERRVELLAAEDTGAAETWVGRLVTETGTVVPVEIEFAVDRSAAGDPRVVGLARDVREREQAGQKLDILNRALRHNIRNQMNLVIGHARTLQDAEDERFRTAAATIEEIGDRVVTMSDKARKAQEYATVPPDEDCRTDLVAAIERVVTKFDITTPGASVGTDLPDSAVARAAPTVEVALLELMENAAVHHPSGEGPVTVTLERSATTVTVHVKDRCDPVPARVTDLIQRGEESPLEHNLGLGLWIVRWVVDPVGGDLAFGRRADGEGNDVTLTFEAIPD